MQYNPHAIHPDHRSGSLRDAIRGQHVLRQLYVASDVDPAGKIPIYHVEPDTQGVIP